MILPEIGGRIHVGRDRTNNYDFFYRQNVIKPALVGLLGPWISGGVEFNWPQHHRPSTFMPVQHVIEEHADGSCTVWLSEHEPVNRMKGMVGICLRPGSALVEAKVRLYNRTPFVQTFLWWANAGIHVDENYQAFFPPDVEFVADHARRALSWYPIARDFYYGVDYRDGVDISWYKNIPTPTSYMVTRSEYDFFGGYDHAKRAGFVHVANHHIAPGKKLWTWGNAEFGYAWDRELTDADGPYIEFMAGVFTDNQPDFSWLQPYETRTFSQFWYPIQEIGPVKNANRLVAVNLEKNEGNVSHWGLRDRGALRSEGLPVHRRGSSLRASGEREARTSAHRLGSGVCRPSKNRRSAVHTRRQRAGTDSLRSAGADGCRIAAACGRAGETRRHGNERGTLPGGAAPGTIPPCHAFSRVVLDGGSATRSRGRPLQYRDGAAAVASWRIRRRGGVLSTRNCPFVHGTTQIRPTVNPCTTWALPYGIRTKSRRPLRHSTKPHGTGRGNLPRVMLWQLSTAPAVTFRQLWSIWTRRCGPTPIT